MNKPLPKLRKQKAAIPTDSVGVETDRVFNAYRPVLVSDGIQTWVNHTYDNRVPWTKDDEAKYIEGTYQQGPYERIDIMQAMLANLPTDNPAITLHADAIRAIHREVQAPPAGFDLERLARLNTASELWTKILIIRDLMPVAREAATQKAERKVMNQKSAKAPRPNGRTVDHDEVITEFTRLTREGHTTREANGMLFSRGLASRATIYRITKQLITSAG